jgi:hypothetical protein
LVKDERDDLLVISHKILGRWNFEILSRCQLFSGGGVRQTEMHTAKSFVLEPTASEVQVAIGKLKRCRSSGVD